MRYSMYKSAFIVGIFLLLKSCDASPIGNFNLGYYLGVVQFSKDKKVSFINQYDKNGKETNKIKFSVEGMGYLDDFIPSDDEKFYVKSSNVISKNEKGYLIEVDKQTNRYSKIDLNLGDIYKIFVDGNFIYITHSVNKLSVYDKRKDKIVNTTKLDDYLVNKFYVDDSNVYLFSRRKKDKSFLNILDKKTLKVVKSFDITGFGLYQNDIYFYDDKIYFTNYDTLTTKNVGRVGIFNTKTQKFNYINLDTKNLDKIVVKDGKIFLTIKGEGRNSSKDALMVIDEKTLKTQKIELDYNAKVFDILNDKILILSNKYLDIYDCGNLFLHNRIKLSLDKNSVASGIIIYNDWSKARAFNFFKKVIGYFSIAFFVFCKKIFRLT